MAVVLLAAVVLAAAVIVGVGLIDGGSPGGANVVNTPERTGAERTAFLAKLPPETAEIIEKYRVMLYPFERLTDEELASLRVDPSAVQPPEAFASRSESLVAGVAWVAECYRQAGFPALVDPPGSNRIVFDGGGVDMMRTMEASSEARLCEARQVLLFPGGQLSRALMTDEELRGKYENIVEEARCLEREGYPPKGIPSYEAWRDQGMTWAAYDAVVDHQLGEGEWDRLNLVCPQY